jgi:hypothetical protein
MYVVSHSCYAGQGVDALQWLAGHTVCWFGLQATAVAASNLCCAVANHSWKKCRTNVDIPKNPSINILLAVVHVSARAQVSQHWVVQPTRDEVAVRQACHWLRMVWLSPARSASEPDT